jgi:phosphoserine phosphatase RsbU/P
MNRRAPQSLLLVFLAAAPALPSALAAQSVLPIPASQCVWHEGDNPAWAAPDFDESGWQPYAQWEQPPGESRIWIRCHADLSALRNLAQLALQVTLYGAYDLYLNGRLVAHSGNLSTGNFSMDAIRAYPVQAAWLAPASSTVALRVSTRRLTFTIGTTIAQVGRTGLLRAGDRALLDALRARTILDFTARSVDTSLCYGAVTVLAVLMLGLYFFNRNRTEFLLLGLTCLFGAAVRANEFCVAAMQDYSLFVAFLIALVGNIGTAVTQTTFFFVLARRRVSLLFRIFIALAVLDYLIRTYIVLLSTNESAGFGHWMVEPRRVLGVAVHLLLSLAPFFAFWPYRRLPRGLRSLAVLCMVWSLADFAWYAVEATNLPIPGVPRLFDTWGGILLENRAGITATVLAALFGLLFREQRQVVLERAALAGEMQAASEIQHMLAPSQVDTAPGLRIEVAFRPMRDVGGDFYLCRVLPDGRQRVLVGDVSGKGTAAAMAATLLLGAAAARGADPPAGLLQQLNRVLGENHLSGFATCLCADVAPGGALTLANAGHLAPYRDGREVELASGLPLGIAPDARYEETALHLDPGGKITFLSDGVVEARNASGELFGFERTAGISGESAESIAQAAQAFGQQDDITVLTLSLAPAEVLHA